MRNEFAQLLDQLDAERTERELTKAYAAPATEVMRGWDRPFAPVPNIKPIIAELDTLLKALPPPVPTVSEMRARIAQTRQLLGRAVDARRLTAFQAARCEARLHLIGAAVLR